jgi:hypothetical protein
MISPAVNSEYACAAPPRARSSSGAQFDRAEERDAAGLSALGWAPSAAARP